MLAEHLPHENSKVIIRLSENVLEEIHQLTESSLTKSVLEPHYHPNAV